jgi:hypothetical protein
MSGTPHNAARALELYQAFTEGAPREDVPSGGFLLSIQPEHGSTALWIRDELTGNPQQVILFVQRCAEAFGLSGHGGSRVNGRAVPASSDSRCVTRGSWTALGREAVA